MRTLNFKLEASSRSTCNQTPLGLTQLKSERRNFKKYFQVSEFEHVGSIGHTDCSNSTGWRCGSVVWTSVFGWRPFDLSLTCDHFVDKVSAMGHPPMPIQHSITLW